MTRHTHKTGFTLVEILIVVIILGILAAIVIPQFTNASEDAKGSNLLSQLQTIRSQLELYQLNHNGAYPDLSTDWHFMTQVSDQNEVIPPAAGETPFGPYLQQPPTNPFENSISVSGSKTTDGTAAAGVGWCWSGGIIYAVLSTAKRDQLYPNGNTNILVYP